MSARYTEDTLVQQTMAEYLELQLGWESVYAYNNEDFGPDSLLGRDSDREVVLTRILSGKLVELNPELPDAVCGRSPASSPRKLSPPRTVKSTAWRATACRWPSATTKASRCGSV
ncbi:MAG: hypothetical protein O3B01_12500 [Planctomycetota bacterium]|nr:hypothetical protein [Planctomycetota bacterium]MDA1139397.1 hypothetical protein [Planctomycetota bacterium]